jgi:hypothetical protein
LAKGEELLKRLHEPNETRLGLSEGRVRGHGFGDQLAERLWDTLATTPACVSAVLTQLEDVPLYIKGVGGDLVSDLTTRVTFSILAEFTTAMMSAHPALTRQVSTALSPVWNSSTLDWDEIGFTLPFVEGHQLLLVPKDWIYWRLHMTSEQFYNRYSTQTIQDEQTSFDSRGKALKPLKEGIRQRHPDRRLLNNEQSIKYKDDDLLGQYRQWIDRNYEPMDDDAISGRL